MGHHNKPLDLLRFKGFFKLAVSCRDKIFFQVFLGSKEGVDLAIGASANDFFDLDNATFKEVLEPQLKKLVDVLNQYPTMKLDIRSHTDSRQSASNNMISPVKMNSTD